MLPTLFHCRIPRLLTSLALGCAIHASAAENAPSPPPLLGVTDIRVTFGGCRSQPRSSLEVHDPEQVRHLSAEMVSLRQPQGIAAVKFGCATSVAFLKAGLPIAQLEVFPCSAIEQAPVSGRRYFLYPAGLNQLPALRRLVGGRVSDVACQ